VEIVFRGGNCLLHLTTFRKCVLITQGKIAKMYMESSALYNGNTEVIAIVKFVRCLSVLISYLGTNSLCHRLLSLFKLGLEDVTGLFSGKLANGHSVILCCLPCQLTEVTD
jgi:hypothetical protein